MRITPVVLCGGSGTRLWPLSRKSFPKQFVPLINNKSLLGLTLERLAPLCEGASKGTSKGKGSQHIICVASEDHRFLVSDALGESVGASTRKTVLLEPTGRNTTAAMAIAALALQYEGENPDELLLFCPADHHIPDIMAFAQCVSRGVTAAQSGAIVTFGVSPTFPSTAYGYIEHGDLRPDGSHRVKRFIEKPKAVAAQQLLLKGGVSWNAGIFLTSARTLLSALELHAQRDKARELVVDREGGCECTCRRESSTVERRQMAAERAEEGGAQSRPCTVALRSGIVFLIARSTLLPVGSRDSGERGLEFNEGRGRGCLVVTMWQLEEAECSEPDESGPDGHELGRFDRLIEEATDGLIVGEHPSQLQYRGLKWLIANPRDIMRR